MMEGRGGSEGRIARRQTAAVIQNYRFDRRLLLDRRESPPSRRLLEGGRVDFTKAVHVCYTPSFGVELPKDVWLPSFPSHSLVASFGK